MKSALYNQSGRLSDRHSKHRRPIYSFGFRCINCRQYVSTLPFISGVNHRNHCPYCLWSKHMDLSKPGDRLSACKTSMQPIGLTIKRVKKKYGLETPGELMLIHRCLSCGTISLNRLAADDDPQAILELLNGCLHIAPATRALLAADGICCLGMLDFHLARARIFGKN